MTPRCPTSGVRSRSSFADTMRRSPCACGTSGSVFRGSSDMQPLCQSPCQRELATEPSCHLFGRALRPSVHNLWFEYSLKSLIMMRMADRSRLLIFLLLLAPLLQAHPALSSSSSGQDRDSALVWPGPPDRARIRH